MKTEKTANPATVAANELKEVANRASFGAETEAVQGEVVTQEEAVAAMADNFMEDESIFEAKISAFGAKLKAQSRALRNAMKEETTSRLSQARILYAIDSGKLLKGTEYKGLGEYAEDVFGMKKSQASKLKNAYSRFFATPLTTSNGYQLKLSLAQSEELLAANDDDVQAMIDSGEITDSMSSREIRDTIKARKPVKQSPAKVYTWKQIFVDGTESETFTATAEYVASIAYTGATISAEESVNPYKVVCMTHGSNESGDFVAALLSDGTYMLWQNLGEVKPEKKAKK